MLWNPCSFREVWASRQTLRTQSPLPGSSTCSTGSCSTQQCTGRRQVLPARDNMSSPCLYSCWHQAIRVAKVGITKHPWLSYIKTTILNPIPVLSAWFSKAVRITAWSFFPSFLLAALFNSFWTCQVIWNWGRRLRIGSYNFYKLRQIGQHPCVTSCLAEARCPSTGLLSTKQCVQLQRRCCLLWNHLGQGGNSWD